MFKKEDFIPGKRYGFYFKKNPKDVASAYHEGIFLEILEDPSNPKDVKQIIYMNLGDSQKMCLAWTALIRLNGPFNS